MEATMREDLMDSKYIPSKCNEANAWVDLTTLDRKCY